MTKRTGNDDTTTCPGEEPIRNVNHMARRAADGRGRSRAWRTAAVAVAAAATFGLASTVAHADEPAPAPDTTATTNTSDGSAAVGEFDGAEVAVDLPPVPPTTIADAVEVAVDVPPVPPTTIDDAVEVAVDVPPVPSMTIPDSPAIVASEAPVPAGASKHRTDKQADAESQLPETGAAAAGATAIVAGAAVSIGVALRALANRA